MLRTVERFGTDCTAFKVDTFVTCSVYILKFINLHFVNCFDASFTKCQMHYYESINLNSYFTGPYIFQQNQNDINIFMI